MEQPPSRLPKPSGIQRVSRVPLPHEPEKAAPQNNAVNPIFKRRPKPDAQKDTAITNTAGMSADRVVQQASIDSRSEKFTSIGSLDAAPEILLPGSRTLPRRPRPSLTDRTIETLSQIPPSPSPRRRKSSLFTSERPTRSSSRPASSLSGSRPSTSHGQYSALTSGFPTPRPPSPTKRPLVPAIGDQFPNVTPSKRAVSSYVPRSLPHRQSNSKLPGNVDSTPSKSKPSVTSINRLARKPGDSVANNQVPKDVGGSKTLAARPSKPRPSAPDAFTTPSSKMTGTDGAKAARGQKASSTLSAGSGNTHIRTSPSSKRFLKTSSDSADPAPSQSAPANAANSPKSSAALRETIAKAKAARRNASEAMGKGFAQSKSNTEQLPDIEIRGSNNGLLIKRIDSARSDGRLNIAALGLTEIPSEVLDMYHPESSNTSGRPWYESVDLVRLIAADNEIEYLKEEVFPDEAADEHSTDDDYRGNMFGGLETLDLHGNHLKGVPLGLRRLEHLTTLNISKNSLGNECLEVVSQIESLKELRLAENRLQGALVSQLCNLKKLEILDLQNNALDALRCNMDEMLGLRALHVDGNRLASLPFECLLSLPLVDLSAARNRLSGSLFPSTVKAMPHLKLLDVSNNALTSITIDGSINLPALQSFSVTENRLADLPDISGWTELITLTARGNKMTSFPKGVTTLQKLKGLDISRNEIKKIDERFGLMDSLATLLVGNNPLRERKFLTMETAEMKREFRSRLLVGDAAEAAGDDPISYDGTDHVADVNRVTSQLWPLKPGGILDRSSTNLDVIEISDIESLVKIHCIKTLIVHHNLLPSIPQAIAATAQTLTVLDISHNKLANASYLSDSLELPQLKSLNLSANSITSIHCLLECLIATNLAELNISRNRVTSLPKLRDRFPSLTYLFASDNSISEVPVEVVRGLHVLDVSGNEISQLEPKLGLLGAEGLRAFDVGGNRFRVPRRDVVERGTGAVLAYLKSRIPDEEMPGLG